MVPVYSRYNALIGVRMLVVGVPYGASIFQVGVGMLVVRVATIDYFVGDCVSALITYRKRDEFELNPLSLSP